MTTTSSRRMRYSSAAETMTRQSRLSAKAWRAFEKSCVAFYGRSYGATVYDWIRRGETDPAFACKRLLGVEPVWWWLEVWEAMREHRYIPVRVGNSGSKTTGYAITDMLAGFYQWNKTPEWGDDEYRILHLAPEEAQALECKNKMAKILDDKAREQMYKVAGGYDYRPCLLTPFFEEGKPDERHQGYYILDGASTITFRPTTYKAKGSDGTDPAIVTWDELRWEKSFNEVLNTVIMSRFLRVPFARALFFFTSLGASIDLTMAFNRGMSGLPEDVDWYSLALDDLRKANPHVDDDAIARANRNIDSRYLPMVMSGKPIQPEGAKFSLASVEAMFVGTTTPDWLSDLAGVRARAVARCEICQKIAHGEAVLHYNNEAEHPLIGYMDVASSAKGADAIVATAWDLQPPTFPRRWAEVVYIEELPPGTKIQRVGLHIALLSMVIHGVVGFDQNSALGHNVTDQLAEFEDREAALDGELSRKYLENDLRERLRRADLADEPDIVPVEHNSKKEKDIDLDYLVGLTDLEKISCPFHFRTKAEMANYKRNDTAIAQDYVMAQVGAAFLAKFVLPDMYAERSSRDKGGRVRPKNAGREDAYMGVGGDDPYLMLPAEASAALGAIDAFAGHPGVEER